MTWVLEDAPDVPPHLVGTLSGLANHADHLGRGAYPGQKLLAHYARKSDRSVRNDLEDLIRLRLIRLGDQRLVAHIPADERPIVYDLAMERSRPAFERKSASAPSRSSGESAIEGDGSQLPLEIPVTSGLGRKHTSARQSASARKPTSKGSGSPLPTNRPVTVLKNSPSESSTGAAFEEFWAIWPKHVKRTVAEKSWATACKIVDASVIIEAAKLYAASVAGWDAQFIAHASSWLNQKRWTDDPPPPRRANGASNVYRNPEPAAAPTPKAIRKASA